MSTLTSLCAVKLQTLQEVHKVKVELQISLVDELYAHPNCA